MAPGRPDITEAVRASYHLLLGHGLAAAAIRAAAKLPAQVGIVINLEPVRAGDRLAEDIAAAERADGHTNRWWLDPVFGRGFPADMLRAVRRRPARAAGRRRHHRRADWTSSG